MDRILRYYVRDYYNPKKDRNNALYRIACLSYFAYLMRVVYNEEISSKMIPFHPAANLLSPIDVIKKRIEYLLETTPPLYGDKHSFLSLLNKMLNEYANHDTRIKCEMDFFPSYTLSYPYRVVGFLDKPKNET